VRTCVVRTLALGLGLVGPLLAAEGAAPPSLWPFTFKPTRNPAFARALDLARGEKVELALSRAPAGGAGTFTGTILSVERHKEAVGKNTVEVVFLVVWSAEGVKSVKLSEVRQVRFLNPLPTGELKKALEKLRP
jgi:hypothetical protein